MARDQFLKLKDIDGESTDKAHAGEIEVLSWSWGESQSASFGTGGGGGAGKVSMQDVSFSTEANQASPKLFLACATGTHIPEATLTVRKAGGEQMEYFVMKLKDILVTSYQSGGSSGSETPIDSFSLNFAEIAIEYYMQKEDGTLDSPVKSGYNVAKNTKL